MRPNPFMALDKANYIGIDFTPPRSVNCSGGAAADYSPSVVGGWLSTVLTLLSDSAFCRRVGSRKVLGL